MRNENEESEAEIEGGRETYGMAGIGRDEEAVGQELMISDRRVVLQCRYTLDERGQEVRLGTLIRDAADFFIVVQDHAVDVVVAQRVQPARIDRLAQCFNRRVPVPSGFCLPQGMRDPAYEVVKLSRRGLKTNSFESPPTVDGWVS